MGVAAYLMPAPQRRSSAAIALVPLPPAPPHSLSGPLRFAAENLGPSCSPDNLDLCDEEQAKEIAAFQAKPQSEIEEMVTAATKAGEDAESTFKAEVEKLQKNYEKLSKAKDDAVAAAATLELRIAKMVLASMKKAADSKDEL